MSIGERLRTIRNVFGMTQKELGMACGMADSAIRKYESNTVAPKLETLQKIAKAFNLSVVFILGKPPFDDLEYLKQHKTAIISQLQAMRIFNEKIKPDDVSLKDFFVLTDRWLLAIESMPNGMQRMVFRNPSSIEHDYTTEEHEKLLRVFYLLNADGRAKAVERVEELAEIPKYQLKPQTEQSDGDAPQPCKR